MVIASLPIESRLGLRLGPIVERRLRALERKEWLLSKSRASCLADRLRMVIHTSAARGAPTCSRTRNAIHVGGVAVEAAVITNVPGWQRLVPARGQRHDSRASLLVVVVTFKVYLPEFASPARIDVSRTWLPSVWARLLDETKPPRLQLVWTGAPFALEATYLSHTPGQEPTACVAVLRWVDAERHVASSDAALAALDCLLPIVRVVTAAWARDLADPTGTVRRFALLEFD